MAIVFSDSAGLASDVPDWRERICSTFVELDCEEIDHELFHGSVSSLQCDDLRFSTVCSTRQRVVRSKARLARSVSDDFLLSLQLKGTGVVQQGGRESLQRSGDIVLYDTSRLYDLRFDGDFQQLILTLPRKKLLRAMPAAEDLTAIIMSGGEPATKLVASYVNSLAQQCTDISPAARHVVNTTVFDLVAMAFTVVSVTQGPGTAGDALFNRASSCIDENLTDPEFNPATVAAAMGVSLRYLNMVFAKHNMGVSRTIWHRRVLRAARDLQNRALLHVPITSIAYSVGFNDSAHFTRAFRAVYDMTPSTFRSRATIAS